MFLYYHEHTHGSLLWQNPTHTVLLPICTREPNVHQYATKNSPQQISTTSSGLTKTPATTVLGKTFLKWMICSWPGFIDKGLQQDPMGWEPRKPKNIITGCSKTYLLDQHFFSFRKSSSAGLEQLDILGNIVFGPGVNIHPEWQPVIGSNFSTNRYLHC